MPASAGAPLQGMANYTLASQNCLRLVYKLSFSAWKRERLVRNLRRLVNSM